MGYADGGDAPDKTLQLVPGAVEDARAFYNNIPTPNSALNGFPAWWRALSRPLG